MTIPLTNSILLALNTTFHPKSTIPESQQHDKKNQCKQVALESLHAGHGHRSCRALLAASNHNVWGDVVIFMSPDTECISCCISMVHATACKSHPATPTSKPGELIYMDILPAASDRGLTPKTTSPHMIIFVDACSHFS